MQQTLEPVTFNLATAVNVCAFFKLSSRDDNMLKTFLPPPPPFTEEKEKSPDITTNVLTLKQRLHESISQVAPPSSKLWWGYSLSLPATGLQLSIPLSNFLAFKFALHTLPKSMVIYDVKVHRCLSSRTFCFREWCPLGPSYVHRLALNRMANGRTLLSKLIVKEVSPFWIEVGSKLAAEDVKP